jgi:PAS domain S-box-containing protein
MPFPFLKNDAASGVVSGSGNGPSMEDLEERLRVLEELFSTVADASPDIIALTDLKGNLIFASKVAFELFGFSAAEDLSKHNLTEFIAPEYKELAARNLGALLTTTKEPDEYMAIHPSGRQLWIEVNGALLRDGGGNPKNFLFIVRDVHPQGDRARAQAERGAAGPGEP